MRVSFVIPTWNRSDLLALALASIRAQTLAAAEVIVVDNGSADGSPQLARAGGARVIELGRNRGFSYAVNRGIEAAGGELVAVVNNDLEIEPDWTERLAAALERKGGWFATGKVLDHARRDRIDGAGDAICRGGTAWRLGQGRPDGPLFDQPRATFFPAATALLARRQFFERVGGFDEAFFAYLEDVDLGLRAALMGLAGVYEPSAVAYHRGGASWGAWSAQSVRWMTRNQILLLAKFYPASWQPRVWGPVVAAQALWGAMALRRGRWLAYLGGLAAGVASSVAARRSGAGWRRNGARLATVLAASEAELERFQRATGYDRYWRWYFQLVPPRPPARPEAP